MRYHRQELLIGKENQKLLGKAKIAIVGLGATGSRTAELLARSGIGNIILIDRDIVELSNLQRQTLYEEKDVNLPKAIALKNHLVKINSEIRIDSYVTDLTYENIDLIKCDLILDCTDNLETRYLINDYSLKNKIKWIYSGVVADRGLTFNIIPGKSPCFRCIFNNIDASLLDGCDTVGILNTVASLVSSIQAMQVIKIVTNQECEEDLIHVNVSNSKITKIKVNNKKDCLACNGNYEYLNGKSTDIVKLCGSNSFQIKGRELDLVELKNKIQNSKLNEYCLISDDFIAFKDGRTLIKTKTKEQAKSIYSRYVGN